MKKRMTLGARLLVFTAVCFSVICLVKPQTVFAETVCSEPYIFTQPDGSTVTLTSYGDEFLDWTVDKQGNLVVYDENGAHGAGVYYALWTDDGPVATSTLAIDGQGISMFTLPLASKGSDIPDAVLESAQEARDEALPPLEEYTLDETEVESGLTANVKRKLLMIKITFPNDTRMNNIPIPVVSNQEVYDTMFTGENSVNGYYKSMFGVDYDVFEPLGDGVYEFVYSGNHPGTSSTAATLSFQNIIMPGVLEQNPGLADLIAGLGDGTDKTLSREDLTIGVIYQGYSGAYNSTLVTASGVPRISGTAWSDGTCTVEGTVNGNKVTVKPTGYFIQAMYYLESTRVYALTIGTTCHELGHASYDVRDVYDLNAFSLGAAQGVGYWSLMGSGNQCYKSGGLYSSSPAYWDAYTLTRHNYITPVEISWDDLAEGIVLNHRDIYKITSKGNNQYFLLQQRTVSDEGGLFYRLSPNSTTNGAGGLLIEHVDENVTTRGNGKRTHYIVTVMEAHGGTQHLQTVGGTKGGTDDLYGNGKSAFSMTTAPTSALFSPFTNNATAPTRTIDSGVDLKNILYANGQTTFTVNGEPSETYNITAGTMANGKVTANKATAAAGETVTLTVTPNSGYKLKDGSLKYNGNAVTGNTFTMPAANVTITAEFEQIVEQIVYNVTIGTMTNGKVTANKTTAAAGETVTLTVTPNSGYKLKDGSLKYNGTAVTGNTFTMPAANVTITAEFEQIVEQIVYNVTIGTMANGKVTANKATAAAGETVTLTVTPNSGYKLKDGSLKYNGTAVTGSTFTMPAANVTITAEFETASDTNDPETWNSTKIYNTGDIVTYNGSTYKAKYWTKGDVPGTSAAWELVSGPIPEYSSAMAYSAGDMCIYNGVVYKAKWWTKGDIPDKGGPWEVVQ